MGTTFELFLHLILINGMPRSAYSCASLTANTALLLLKKGDKLEIEHIHLCGDEFKDVDYIYVLQYVNNCREYSNEMMYFVDRDKMLNFITNMGMDEFKSSLIPVWLPTSSNS